MTATRDLVTIGQVWRRVKRGQPKVTVQIVQVRRVDKVVRVGPVGERLHWKDTYEVPFAELRKSWRLGDGS